MAFEWKNIIRTVAPTVATALGGPLAGTATKMIAEALLGKSDATEEEIETALANATPEDLRKLKDLEQQFKLEMKKLGIREKELEYQDIADARSMAEATSYRPQALLTGCFIAGYFAMVIYILTMLTSDVATLNPAILSLVSTLIGVVTSEIPKSMAFWFGSSKGSKDKTAALSRAVDVAVQQARDVPRRVVAQPQAVAAMESAPVRRRVIPDTQPPAPVSTASPSWMADPVK